MTKFILNADDFGLTKHHNIAVLEGYRAGILKSASLIANGDAFSDAVNNVIPNCKELEIAIHLNIIEGKALTNCPMLTDNKGTFNRGYLYFILHQFDKNFKEQVEAEFRAQIELALKNGVKISRADSHVHTHAIPEIFKIAAKLAHEYNIEQIRTQHEAPYLVFPDCLSLKFIVNLVKIALLNTFTFINKKTLKKYSIKTNDNILGVGYTGMMTSSTVFEGIKKVETRKNISTCEVLIHPCAYDDDTKNHHTKEFEITQDESLKSFFS